jgi:hypothetical protein
MIQIDDLVNANSILPPISNNTLGKASGALIKQLLDNLTGEGGKKQQSIAYQNQSKRGNNSGYHSLPPIGPNNNQMPDSKMMIAKPKNIIQMAEAFDKNKINLNFRD